MSDSSTASSSKSVLSNSSISSLESCRLNVKPTIQPFTVKISDSDSGSDIVINKIPTCQKPTKNVKNIISSTKYVHQSDLSRSSLTSSVNKKHKRRISEELLNYEPIISLKKRCDSAVRGDSHIENKQLHLDVFKDSGFSSSSSQDQTPTEDKNIFDQTSSQETIDSALTCHHKTSQFNSESLQFSNPKLASHDSTLSQVSLESADPELYDDPCYNEQKPQSSDCTGDLAKSDHNLGLCMFCLTEQKNSVFVHSNFVHLCCCYKCAMKIWKQRKSCPICNCKVKNVMKLFVH